MDDKQKRNDTDENVTRNEKVLPTNFGQPYCVVSELYKNELNRVSLPGDVDYEAVA